jgi:sugar/nucleoside kinase (ribokinase family)
MELMESPNHDELRTLFSIPTVEQQDENQTRQIIETLLRALLDLGVGRDGQGIVVVRSGSLGACVGTRAHGTRWVPAFYGREDPEKVVDVTGGE